MPRKPIISNSRFYILFCDYAKKWPVRFSETWTRYHREGLIFMKECKGYSVVLEVLGRSEEISSKMWQIWLLGFNSLLSFRFFNLWVLIFLWTLKKSKYVVPYYGFWYFLIFFFNFSFLRITWQVFLTRTHRMRKNWKGIAQISKKSNQMKMILRVYRIMMIELCEKDGVFLVHFLFLFI